MLQLCDIITAALPRTHRIYRPPSEAEDHGAQTPLSNLKTPLTRGCPGLIAETHLFKKNMDWRTTAFLRQQYYNQHLRVYLFSPSSSAHTGKKGKKKKTVRPQHSAAIKHTLLDKPTNVSQLTSYGPTGESVKWLAASFKLIRSVCSSVSTHKPTKVAPLLVQTLYFIAELMGGGNAQLNVEGGGKTRKGPASDVAYASTSN